MNRLEHCTPALLRRIADVLEASISNHTEAHTVAVEMHDDTVDDLVAEAPPEGEGRPVIRAIG